MKLPILSTLILFTCMLCVYACQHSPEADFPLPQEQVINTPQEQKEIPDQEQEPAQITPKRIKQGQLRFETENLVATRKHIEETISHFDGYVAREEQYVYADRIEESVTLRTPAQHFDSLVMAIAEGIKHFDSKHFSVEDVTDQYYDLSARIESKKALESRYKNLLQEASTVEEMLAIEKQMGEIREEIEAAEGRFRYLRNQVDFSTLTVIFYQENPYQPAFPFFQKAGQALGAGWRNLGYAIVGLIHIWPFILLLGLIFWGWRRWRKR